MDNNREREAEAGIVVDVDPGGEHSLTIWDPNSNANVGDNRGGSKSFTFDRVYWSVDDRVSGGAADQGAVFDEIGRLFLDNAFQGYNSSVFAYGQTGSGKTYCMMGAKGEPGIIPLGGMDLFERIRNGEAASGGNTQFSVEVSYLEIYNEVIRDLLNPRNNVVKGGLKVREHAKMGVFVQGLSRLVAESYDDMDKFLTLGGKERTVAATKMNAASSRSHAVFTIHFTQSVKEEGVNDPVRRTSKINLIDLAGSEHQANTGATGARMKEACSINKSLSALSNVISALASQASAKGGKGKRRTHVPYRDSVLTRLLQESLGGNARSIMIAAISPADINYAQSLSTLRYANRAKQIVNKAKVNEGGDGAIIKALKEEIARLNQMLTSGTSADVHELQEQLAAQSELIQTLKMSSDEKRTATDAILEDREASLREQGVTLRDIGNVLGTSSTPYLVNLNPDPSLSESLLYYLREGVTTVGFVGGGGNGTSAETPDIILNGLRIADEHASFDNLNGTVVLTPSEEGPTYVNGEYIKSARTLVHGNRIVFGKSFVFRFVDPQVAESGDGSGSGGAQFGWEEAVREMSAVLGIDLGGQSVNDSLIRAAFLADEANDLARTLNKKAMFAVDIEPQVDGAPQVAIRSTSLLTGSTTVVDVTAFEQRVQAMYELLVTSEVGVGGLRGGDDPFFDPPPDVLVASGSISLKSLSRLVGIDKTVPLSPDGELEVSIHAIDPATYAYLDQVALESRMGDTITFIVTVPAAANLPGDHIDAAFVKFNFLEDADVEVSDRCSSQTRHPVWNYREKFVVVVTDELIEYLSSSRLVFEVYGRAPMVNIRAGGDSVETQARLEYLNTENQELLRLNEVFIGQLETLKRQLSAAQARTMAVENQLGEIVGEAQVKDDLIADLEQRLSRGEGGRSGGGRSGGGGVGGGVDEGGEEGEEEDEDEGEEDGKEEDGEEDGEGKEKKSRTCVVQ